MCHMATFKTVRFVAALILIFAALMAIRCTVMADELKVGIDKRVAWTTSRITGSPEPPLPYVTERAFPSLTFNQCLDITTAPGSDRLFVVEQSGKIFSFPNKPDVAEADLVVDFAKEKPGVKQVYSLIFHPNVEQNR